MTALDPAPVQIGERPYHTGNSLCVKTYEYVPHALVPQYLADGWQLSDIPLSMPHGQYSTLLWRFPLDLDQLQRDLIRDEGVRHFPYRCTAGKLTIGCGRNIEDVGISDDEVEYLLANDIRKAVADLYSTFSWFSAIPEPWQRALSNMRFQLGLRGLLGFKKMLAALEAGDGVEAHRQALDSAYARQTPMRAQRTAKLFLTPAKWPSKKDTMPDEAS